MSDFKALTDELLEADRNYAPPNCPICGTLHDNIKTPCPSRSLQLAEIDERPVTCEERLKACEVQLMLNTADAQKVRQHQLAYDQAVKDIQALRTKIKTLENEIDNLRKEGAHNIDAMKEYMDLIENLDFRVESKRLHYIVATNDHFYLRFDRHGQIKHAYAPEEYNNVIKKEWDSINTI